MQTSITLRKYLGQLKKKKITQVITMHGSMQLKERILRGPGAGAVYRADYHIFVIVKKVNVKR